MSWSVTLKVPMSSPPPPHHHHHHRRRRRRHHRHHHYHRHHHHTLLITCVVTAKVCNTCIGKEMQRASDDCCAAATGPCSSKKCQFQSVQPSHICIGSGFHGKSETSRTCASHRILSEWPAPKTKQKPVKVHGQFRVDYTQLTILAAFVL